MKIKTHGELLIDHRATGIPHPVMGKVYESAIATCTHCQAAVIMNPLRTRERTVCKLCMAYICDNCAGAMAAGAEHRPFAMIVDEAMEAGSRGLPVPDFKPY